MIYEDALKHDPGAVMLLFSAFNRCSFFYRLFNDAWYVNADDCMVMCLISAMSQ